MDLDYTADEQVFRQRVRDFLREAAPPRMHRPLTLEEGKAWQKRLHTAELLGAAWPEEHGGAGLTEMEQAILNEELARIGTPMIPGQYGIWWVGPAILEFGTPEQKQRYLPRILSGDDIWATGYSEPNAGSDMFNTQTVAERRSDHYSVTGQKIWSSIAHESNRYFCLVRVPVADPKSKYDGLTVLLMDLHVPGIDVRPIRQMNGDSDFNEVFLEDVRVPREDRLGEEGQGWRIISSALVNERRGVASGLGFERSLEKAIEVSRRTGRCSDRVMRQRIARLAIGATVAKYSGYRSLTDQLAGRASPHLSAAMKLHGTELAQRFSTVTLDLLGTHGQLLESRDDAPEVLGAATRFLTDRGVTIGGGTSEIQRNIIAERILGLPRR